MCAFFGGWASDYTFYKILKGINDPKNNNHCFQAGLEPDLHAVPTTWGNPKTH